MRFTMMRCEQDAGREGQRRQCAPRAATGALLAVDRFSASQCSSVNSAWVGFKGANHRRGSNDDSGRMPSVVVSRKMGYATFILHVAKRGIYAVIFLKAHPISAAVAATDSLSSLPVSRLIKRLHSTTRAL